jgi:hypothetical protein
LTEAREREREREEADPRKLREYFKGLLGMRIREWEAKKENYMPRPERRREELERHI